MKVVFDIDGTLADHKERLFNAGPHPGRTNLLAYRHYIDTLVKDIDKDAPLEAMRELATALWLGGLEICYLTGRDERLRKDTTEWLNDHGFPVAPLYMRPALDYDSTPVAIKTKIIDQVINPDHEPALMFDDDGESDCREAYLARGFTFLQVHY